MRERERDDRETHTQKKYTDDAKSRIQGENLY